MLVLGRGRTGKTEVLRSAVRSLVETAESGGRRVVVLDAWGDLADRVAADMPSGMMDKFQFIGYGRRRRVPVVNLMDPALFPNQEAGLDVVVRAMEWSWKRWGTRVEDMVRMGLLAIGDYNRHELTGDDEMLGFGDLPVVLGATSDRGNERGLSDVQRHVVHRVGERVKAWFEVYDRWGSREKAEYLIPVVGGLARYGASEWMRVSLGQRRSLVKAPEPGTVTVVSVPMHVVGSLVGQLLLSALGTLGMGAAGGRYLVCDGFEQCPGLPWYSMLWERRRGDRFVVALPSLRGLERSWGGAGLAERLLEDAPVAVILRPAGSDQRRLSVEVGDGLVPKESFRFVAVERRDGRQTVGEEAALRWGGAFDRGWAQSVGVAGDPVSVPVDEARVVGHGGLGRGSIADTVDEVLSTGRSGGFTLEPMSDV